MRPIDLTRARHAPTVECLEQRLLYSATPADAAVGEAATALVQYLTAPAIPAANAVSQTQQGRELVVIDSRVPDLPAVINDLQSQQANGRPLQLVVLSADQDGIQTITALLAQEPGVYGAVHLIGHGEPGVMQLGTTTLDLSAVRLDASVISAWSVGLSRGADLLLYGCDLASSQDGRDLVDALSILTGANVAASVDATGSALFGGNWTLEDQTAPIHTALAISAHEQAVYSGTLGLQAAGAEIRVDTGSGGFQTTPNAAAHQVATNAAGNTVVVYEDTNNGGAIIARMYDATGTAVGAAFQVNTGAGVSPGQPVVAIDTSGKFVITWTSSGQDGSGEGVQARFYDASGTALTGEVAVNQWTTGDQSTSAVAISPTGQVVISWTTTYALRSNTDIGAREFDLTGAGIGSEGQVSSALSTANCINGSLAFGGNGSLVAVWQQANGLNWEVYAQRFSSPGTLVSSPIKVNSGVTSGAPIPDVSADASGNFVVVWTTTVGGGSKTDVFGRVFNADGTARSGEVVINTTTLHEQLAPSVAMLPSGAFVVAWSSNMQDAGGTYGIYTAQFDGNGAPLTGDTLVNVTTSGNQINASVAAAGSQVVYLWGGIGPGGNDGAMLRQFTVSTTGFTVTPTYGLVTTEAGGQANFTVAMTSAPSANVTIPLSVDQVGVATLSTASLTFTPGNWNVAQAVTVTGIRDNLATADRAYQVFLGTAVSADLNYNGLNAPDVTLSNTNVDTRSIVIVDTSSDVADGDTLSLDALLNDRGADGFISLREAIIAANKSTNGLSVDLIQFSIAGAGVHTIDLTFALPPITDPLIIDGYSQPGAAANSAGTGDNATILIELSGALALGGVDGLSVTAGNSRVSGLAITGFPGSGIVSNGANNAFTGNHIGVNANGNTAAGNQSGGIVLNGSGNAIGGTNTIDRNLISGNQGSGIVVNAAAANALIQGNQIGLNATGTAALGNSAAGITVGAALATQIGGTLVGTGNVISGNALYGVVLNGATSAGIEGNLIGRNASNSANVPNTGAGVAVDAGTSVANIDQNTIVGNNGAGVLLSGGSGTWIHGNSIDNNAGLGIDLGADGVSLNDAGDADTGANSLQNFPLLSSVTTDGSNLQATIELNSAPSTSFLIELFASPSADASGYGQGQRFLGTFSVSTDASGYVASTQTLPCIVAVGEFVTATATNAITQDTSEFAANLAASAPALPPTVTLPASVAVNEDQPITLAGISVNQTNGNVSSVDLSVTQGTLTFSPAGGVTVVGSGSSSITLTGPAGALATAGASVVYQSVTNFNGADTLTVTAYGAGSLTTTNSSPITVAPGNDAPTLVVPAAQSVTANTVLLFGTGFGNAISLADVDAGANPVQLALGVLNGTLTLSGTSGLSFSGGTGSNDPSMTMSGTLASINAALQGMQYLGSSNYSGPDTLTVSVNDMGNIGAGGPITITQSVALSVTAVNMAPSVAVPSAQSVAEDTNLVFGSASSNPITVADADAGSSPLQLTLSVSGGTLSLATTAGLAFSSGAGSNDATMTLIGTQASINAALNGLVYRGHLNFNGADSLNLTVNDLGNTGVGGPLTIMQSVALAIAPVNDAPVLVTNVPVSLVGNSQVPIDQNTLAIIDVESGPAALIYTLRQDTAGVQIMFNSRPLRIADSFTQADINAGRLSAVRSGATGVNGAFVFDVMDGAGSTLNNVQLTIQTDAPVAAPSVVRISDTGVTLSSAASSAVGAGITSGSNKGTSDAVNSVASGPFVASPAAAVISPSPASNKVAYSPATFKPIATTQTANTSRNAATACNECDTVADSSLHRNELGGDVLRRANLEFELRRNGNLSNSRTLELQNASAALPATFNKRLAQQQLSQIQEQAKERLNADSNDLAATMAVSTGISIGYVIWLIRGGVLLSSLLASVPAWTAIDPLPVLSSFATGRSDDVEDDSLQEILRKAKADSVGASTAQAAVGFATDSETVV